MSRWVGKLKPHLSGLEGQNYLTKWLLLSTIIGIVAGLGAVLFSLVLDLATEFLLGTFVGYHPPAPIGEGSPEITTMLRPLALPFLTTLGGLASGVLVFTLAPEAEGHGTDAAIDSMHHKRGRIRARIPPIKMIASAITIGTGGSGGREGPAAQISAGFGSLLGNWLGLSVQERRILVAAGMGAGIGAIFRAPLGGALMAAEILYIHDLEVEAIIPSLIASIVGYTVFGALVSFAPIFGAQPQLGFEHPIQLLYYGALGIACGLTGLLYARSFYGTVRVFHRLRMPNWLKPAIGGLLVGLLGLVLPEAIHTGYGWVQIGMTQELLQLPILTVLILPFAKILATSLSIGSGGSGGIFGPGMVIGGMLGALFWRLTYGVLPQMTPEPAPFVIIGMMATFGGIAHAPLAVMLMVAEMTGNLSLLAPAMVAVAISTALVGNNTIYEKQLPNRAHAPVHRVRFSFPLLSSLLVRDAMSATEPAVGAQASVSTAEALLTTDGTADVMVLDKHHSLLGFVTHEHIKRISPAERARVSVQDALETTDLTLDSEQTLDVALDRIAARGLRWAPVVEDGRVIGRLTVRNVLQTYKATLEKSVRRATALPADTALFEVNVATSSPLAGHLLSEAVLPPNTLVVSVVRDGEVIFPRANTRLEPGDKVMIMADPAVEPTLRTFLESSSAAAMSQVPQDATGTATRSS